MFWQNFITIAFFVIYLGGTVTLGALFLRDLFNDEYVKATVWFFIGTVWVSFGFAVLTTCTLVSYRLTCQF